jgi:hypothetical protein
MQVTGLRSFLLIAVLAVGAWFQFSIVDAKVARDARWPTDDALFVVPGWRVSSASNEEVWGLHHSTRTYQSLDGSLSAVLLVSTSPEVKRVYGKGPDIAFQGTGYAIEPARPSLVPEAPRRTAVVLRGEDTRLLISTYGERRGRYGNGPAAWSLAALDAITARPNDYYLLRLVAPLDERNPAAVERIIALADATFPRVAAWYASQHS